MLRAVVEILGKPANSSIFARARRFKKDWRNWSSGGPAGWRGGRLVNPSMNLRKFGTNAFLYVIGTVGLRAASFVLIPIYTYSLALDDYGLLAVLLQTAQIMVIVMSLGSRTALVRFAKEYEARNQFGVLV